MTIPAFADHYTWGRTRGGFGVIRSYFGLGLHRIEAARAIGDSAGPWLEGIAALHRPQPEQGPAIRAPARPAPAQAIAAAVLAMVVFAVDTFTPLDIAVAVLYVAVVLLSIEFASERGVRAIGVGCIALTVSSFAFSYTAQMSASSLGRCLMSVTAISIVTFLAERTRSTMRLLREQAELLDLTHDTVFVRDTDDRITYWNKGAEELYGWPRSQAVGRNCHQLLQTSFPAPLQEIAAMLRERGRWEGELVHTRRDGAKVIVASRWSLQGEGAAAIVLETNIDITARKQTEEHVRQMEAELAHATRVATLGELTATIAHEVNQPLAAIVASGDAALRWLRRPVPELEEVQSGLERIVADGTRAGDVIRRLRSLAKKDAPLRTPVDVNEVIADSIAIVGAELRRHRVAVSVEASRLPPVLGDKVQLQQVVINLIVNGIQAMAGQPEGGRRLLIRTVLEGPDQVQITVADTGPGLAPDAMTRLFDPFYTTKADGTGLGLSICRSIIQAHGGRIWVTANAEGGASLHVTVAAQQEAA